MKKSIAIAVLTYLGAILIGCVLAGITSLPFLEAGDFSIQFEMIIMAFMSGFYILTITPLVIVAEVIFRRLGTHRIVPLAAIPLFGAIFPVLGFVAFPDKWWPEEPLDMSPAQRLAFISLVLLSTGTGIVLAAIKNRSQATGASGTGA